MKRSLRAIQLITARVPDADIEQFSLRIGHEFEATEQNCLKWASVVDFRFLCSRLLSVNSFSIAHSVIRRLNEQAELKLRVERRKHQEFCRKALNGELPLGVKKSQTVFPIVEILESAAKMRAQINEILFELRRQYAIIFAACYNRDGETHE